MHSVEHPTKTRKCFKSSFKIRPRNAFRKTFYRDPNMFPSQALKSFPKTHSVERPNEIPKCIQTDALWNALQTRPIARPMERCRSGVRSIARSTEGHLKNVWGSCNNFETLRLVFAQFEKFMSMLIYTYIICLEYALDYL